MESSEANAGTRCNSLGAGARSKPSRWGSNHEGGTRRDGWHRLAKGEETLWEWTRAGDVGRAPSERAVCLGDEATRYGGGSAAAESHLVRGAGDPSEDLGDSTNPTDWCRRSNASENLQLIRPVIQGDLDLTGPAGFRFGGSPLPHTRVWECTGLAACAWEFPTPGGRARARPGVGQSGRIGVVPWRNRCTSARGKPRSASTPRDRARIEGARAGRQSS